MAAKTKMVYVMFNENYETLYNKVLGTWNDGKNGRDGSSVWTFSARKPAEESKTIINSLEHLAKLGFTKVTVELREVEYDGNKAHLVVDEVPFGNEMYLPAIIDESVYGIVEIPVDLDEEGVSEEEIEAANEAMQG